MIRYIINRILMIIPVLLGVSLIIFALQYLTPGDPARLMLGDEATEEELYEWREQYGLNDSFLEQYFTYMFNIATKGDLGTSWRTGQDITTQILSRWPTTFALAIATTLVSTIVGLLLGIVAANNRGTIVDSITRVLGMIGVSVPNFWFALLLIMLFAVNLKWLPVSGSYGPQYYVLPSLSLGLLGAAQQMRIVRSSMLDCICADYVRTARAKGQSEGVITRHHILRNALIPIINSVGSNFAAGLGGAMILEQIFAIPGLGTLMTSSINTRDYAQLRGSVLLVAVSVSIVNLLIDLAYAAVDPRVKAGFKRGRKARKLTFFKKKGGNNE